MTSTIGDLKQFLRTRTHLQTSELYLQAGPWAITDDRRIGDLDFPRGFALSFRAVLPRRQGTFKAPDGGLVKIRYSKRTTVSKAVREICRVLKISHADTLRVLHGSEVVAPKAFIADLDLPPDAVLKIDDPPRELRVVYRPIHGRPMVAQTRYRGIATGAKIRQKLVARFHVESVATGLFYDGEPIPEDENLADLNLPPDATVEFRALGEEPSVDLDDVSPPASAIDIGSLSPMRSVILRTPSKRVRAQFKPGATVGRAKEVLARRLGVEVRNVNFHGAADGSFLRDLSKSDDTELSIHIYQPVIIEASTGQRIAARYAETATIKSAKEKIAPRIGVPIGDLTFELEYSDEDTPWHRIEVPPSRVVLLTVSRPAVDSDALDEIESPERPADDIPKGGDEAAASDDEFSAAEGDDKIAAPAGEDEAPPDEKGSNAAPASPEEEEEEEAADVAIHDPVPRQRALQSTRLLLRFPDRVIQKIRFQSKATVANVRAAVARELGAAPDEVVLSYGPTKLTDDHRLITTLGIPHLGFINVRRE